MECWPRWLTWNLAYSGTVDEHLKLELAWLMIFSRLVGQKRLCCWVDDSGAGCHVHYSVSCTEGVVFLLEGHDGGWYCLGLILGLISCFDGNAMCCCDEGGGRDSSAAMVSSAMRTVAVFVSCREVA